MTDPTPPIEIPDDQPQPGPDIEPSPPHLPEIQPADAPPEMPRYEDDAGPTGSQPDAGILAASSILPGLTS